MKKLDARKLTPEIQQHNRDLAIRLFQQGQKRADIAEIVGVHYGVACRWIRAWAQGGEKAIKQGQRGRRPEEQRRLTAAQETVLKKLICDKNPDQMKLPFALAYSGEDEHRFRIDISQDAGNSKAVIKRYCVESATAVVF